MSHTTHSPDGPAVERGQFETTHWSLILAAADSQAPGAGVALERLCVSYWYPLYVYVRRKGHAPEDAQDLTQEFFARLLEKRHVKLADRDRGRFRSFLLKSLQHFLTNEWTRAQAQKRGSGQPLLSLDAEAGEKGFAQEPTTLSPESLYDRGWAFTLLDRAMETLRGVYVDGGKSDLFDALKPLLLNEGLAEAYDEIALRLGVTGGAAKVAVHRLRHRFRGIVREEISQTLSTPQEIDEELRYLIAALST